MDQGLKERLVGAAVLVAIAVWLIPWVLDGPEAPVETTAQLAAVAGGRRADADAHADAAARRRREPTAEHAPTRGAARDRAGARPTPKRRPSRSHARDGGRDGTRRRRRCGTGAEPERAAPPAAQPAPAATAATAPPKPRDRGSERRLDRAARQLRRGSQCAARRAARRHVRLQGRGFELSKRRADAVSRPRRPADDARGKPTPRRRRCAPTASTTRAWWLRAEPLNDAGRLRHLVSDALSRLSSASGAGLRARRCRWSRCWPRSAWRGLFAGSLEPSLGDWASAAEVRLWTARVIIFVVVLVIGGLVSWLARKLIRHTGLSGLDRTLGAAFGLLRAAVLLGLAVHRAAVCRARSGGVVAGSASSAVCRARRGSRQVLRGARHAVLARAAGVPICGARVGWRRGVFSVGANSCVDWSESSVMSP